MTEEGLALYTKAIEASEELRIKLSKVRIKVDGARSPQLIEAIRALFGSTYITDKGDSYITYDMYCSVVNLLRSLGTKTAEETL